MRSTEGGNKIVVIGAGNVGETICYTLMLKTQVSEIVLIDLNEDRAKGVALDISHGTAYYIRSSSWYPIRWMSIRI